MAGSFSNRKVARAARTGGSRRRGGGGNYGYKAVIVLICIFGVALVAVSRNDRLSTTNYGNTPPLAPIPGATESDPLKRQGDHWYEAYGIYICDKFAANINNPENPYGIATNNDGVIYIAPFERKYAGTNSTLGLFAKAVDLKISRTSFQIPGDQTVYNTDAKCNGKEGEFVLKEWTDAKDPNSGRVVKSNPQDLLLKDNHALTIAFVPTGTDPKDIPMPPSAATLDASKALAESGGQGATATTLPTTETTAAPTTTPPTTTK